MIVFKRFLLSLWLLACLSACSDNQPTLDPLAPDAVILAFGDSLTYGTGAARDQSYPAVLTQLLDRTVVNSGIPGEVSQTGLSRLSEVLAEVQPALLILCHGGNDLLRRGNADQLKQNLQSMIDLAQAQGIQVLLVAVPEPSIRLSPPQLYRDLAQQYGLPLEADILKTVLSQSSLKSDPIHPNAAGYRLMAEAMANQLLAAGAVSYLANP